MIAFLIWLIAECVFLRVAFGFYARVMSASLSTDERGPAGAMVLVLCIIVTIAGAIMVGTRNPPNR